MNIQPSISDAAVGGAGGVERPALKKIRCLVPIWGYAYVRKFLEVGLPTWLAGGNLPAISRMVPTFCSPAGKTRFICARIRVSNGCRRYARPRFILSTI